MKRISVGVADDTFEALLALHAREKALTLSSTASRALARGIAALLLEAPR